MEAVMVVLGSLACRMGWLVQVVTYLRCGIALLAQHRRGLERDSDVAGTSE